MRQLPLPRAWRVLIWAAAFLLFPAGRLVAADLHQVSTMAEAVLKAGGSAVGEMAVRDVPDVGRLHFQYMRDPEGNMIELLNWT